MASKTPIVFHVGANVIDEKRYRKGTLNYKKLNLTREGYSWFETVHFGQNKCIKGVPAKTVIITKGCCIGLPDPKITLPLNEFDVLNGKFGTTLDIDVGKVKEKQRELGLWKRGFNKVIEAHFRIQARASGKVIFTSSDGYKSQSVEEIPLDHKWEVEGKVKFYFKNT